MNAFKSVEDTIKGHFCCDIASTGGRSLMDCDHCPYNDDEDKHGNACVTRLNNDVQYYLKQEQKHIEAEMQKAQPPLPGIFDDPVTEKIADKLISIAEEAKEEAKEQDEPVKRNFHNKKWNRR